MGNDNWWKTHGIGCEGAGEGKGSGAENDSTAECAVSYAVSIETQSQILVLIEPTFSLYHSLSCRQLKLFMPQCIFF